MFNDHQNLTSSKCLSTNRLSTMDALFRQTISPSNRHIISQYLLDSEQELRGCQSEIQRLRVTMLMLEKRQNRLKKNMERYRCLLYPIHRVPTEILSTIFSLCCERSVLSPSDTPPVITLSRVCGRWREIVISLPELWSSIAFGDGGWDKDNWNVLNGTVRLFMERSKAAPLDLELNLWGVDLAGGFISSALVALVQQSSRWRRLNIGIDDLHDLDNDIFQPIKGHLPTLEQLYLDGWGHEPFLSDWADLFSKCPSLNTLSLYNTASAGYTHIPLQQITSLELFYISASLALSVMGCCSKLERLEVGEVEGDEGNRNHFFSEMLTHVSITGVSAQDDASFIFEHTTFPKLRALHICSSYDVPNEQDWPSPKAFLLRSSCFIMSLQLKCIPITDEQTAEFLRLLPTLEELEIEEYRRADKNVIVTPLLMQCFTSGSFVPRLTRASFVVNRAKLDDETFTTALTCRWKPACEELGVACLQDVTVTVVGKGPSIPSFKAIESFRNADIRVSVSYVS